MADSASKVLTERRGRTFLVTINRPEVRNCIDSETAQLLFEAGEAFRIDQGLDVLVLAGAGEIAFCSGADLRDIGGLAARPGAQKSGPMGLSRITEIKPGILVIS